MDPEADLLAEADGLRVFAPGWRRRRAVPAGVRELAVEDVVPVATPGAALRFGSGARATDRAVLLRGWSVPEPHGHWEDGADAALALQLPPSGAAAGSDEPLDLCVRGLAFLPPQRPEQRVTVSVAHGGAECGETSTEWRFGGAEGTAAPPWRSAAVPPACAAGTAEGPASRLLRVRLSFPDAVSPRAIGLSADDRSLAFAIAEMVVLHRGEGPP